MTGKELLQNTDIFLLDMDGTIYLEETPIGDMKNTLRRLRDAGKKLVYCTNNSSRSPEGYVEKLKRIGFWDERDSVYTSAIAAAVYLTTKEKGKSVYAVATDEVKADLQDCGVVLEEENPDICLFAYDTGVTFQKLKKFNEFLMAGKKYIVTHPDTVCPAYPVPMPDVGAFIKLFECSSGRLPDVICGKPYKEMGEGLESLLHTDKSKIAMVGDRLHTDIRFANNSGFTSVLVFSGETTHEMAQKSSDKADISFENFNKICDFL